MAFSPENTQTKYAVTISTRAALSILSNILTAVTLEQFPTETRGFSTSVCMSVGYLIGGIGFGNVPSLSTNLIISMFMIQLMAVIASLFIRETKQEPGLLNYYQELCKESEPNLPLKNEPMSPSIEVKEQNP